MHRNFTEKSKNSIATDTENAGPQKTLKKIEISDIYRTVTFSQMLNGNFPS